MAPFLFLFMPRNRKRRCWPDHNDDNAMIEINAVQWTVGNIVY